MRQTRPLASRRALRCPTMRRSVRGSVGSDLPTRHISLAGWHSPCCSSSTLSDPVQWIFKFIQRKKRWWKFKIFFHSSMGAGIANCSGSTSQAVKLRPQRMRERKEPSPRGGKGQKARTEVRSLAPRSSSRQCNSAFVRTPSGSCSAFQQPFLRIF